MAEAAKDTERLVVSLEARINQFEKSFAKANKTANDNWTSIEKRGQRASRNIEAGFAQAALKVGASMKTIAASLAGAFAGGIAVGGLSQLPTLIRSTVASAAGIADVADRIGVTTTRLQELRFAADQSGVAADDLDASLEQFSRRIGEAAAGGGNLLKILQANGIALRSADGTLRPINDLLADFADLLKNAANDQDRLALATDAFGRGGTDMVNLLREGAGGLQEMTARARELGAVLDEELVRAAADVDDKFAILEARFTTFVQSEIITFVGELEGAMADLAGAADVAANAWASFEATWNKLAGISPEQAAKSKLRAALVRGSITGKQGQDQDFSDWLQFQEAPKGDLPGAVWTRPTIVPQARTGGAGAGRRASAADSIARERERVDELISSLEEERRLIGASEADQQLSNALRRAGASATDAQKQKIRELVPAIEAERAAHDRLEERMQGMRDMGREALGGILHDLKDGKSLADVFADALDNLTDRLLDMALGGLFVAPASGGAGGGILGAITKLFGFSAGGWTGDGPTDRIAGVVHGREYVVNADVARKHLPLLEALNSGKIPGFAKGGYVGGPAIRVPNIGTGGAQTVNFAPSINVTVEGGSRGPEADQQFAADTAKAVEGSIRSLVVKELLAQSRPGGLLNH